MYLDKIFCHLLFALLLLSGSVYAQKASSSFSFNPDNLLIVRVGDGKSPLTSGAAAIFLEEYTPKGTFVQSVPMPVKGKGAHAAFVLSGNNITHGFSALSSNGQFVTLIGYDAEPGMKEVQLKAAATPKVIALISAKGIDTRTAEAIDIVDTRTAVTSNGKDIWFAGQKEGVRYIHARGSKSERVTMPSTNAGRQLSIFDGQLYVSTANPSGFITKIGKGTPIIPSRSSAIVTYMPDMTFLAHGYVFFDVNPSVAGADLLYVNVDQGTGFLRKYINNGNSWEEVGTPVKGAIYKNTALTGTLQDGNPVLFASAADKVVKIIDLAASAEQLNVQTETILTAAPNTAFRGLSFTPDSKPVLTKK